MKLFSRFFKKSLMHNSCIEKEISSAALPSETFFPRSPFFPSLSAAAEALSEN